MKKYSKFFSTLFASLLIFSMLPMQAFAAPVTTSQSDDSAAQSAIGPADGSENVIQYEIFTGSTHETISVVNETIESLVDIKEFNALEEAVEADAVAEVPSDEDAYAADSILLVYKEQDAQSQDLISIEAVS
jgi:hypothetical protein